MSPGRADAAILEEFDHGRHPTGSRRRQEAPTTSWSPIRASGATAILIERVGFYNPMASGGEEPLRVAIDRVGYWSGVGAQLSPTVTRLVEQAKAATAA